MEKGKEKVTKILCEYCLKRSVCKYTEEFGKLMEKFEPPKLEVLELTCSQYIDYRKVTYRRG